MSVAGALFAAVVAAVVVAAVWSEVSWRARPQPVTEAAAGHGPAALRSAPPVVRARRRRRARREVVRAVVAALVAAALSVAGALALVRGELDGSLPITRDSLVGCLALVALATVVATLGASSRPAHASAVGLLLGAPPAVVVVAVACFNEGDGFWLLVALILAVPMVGISLAVWAITVLSRWGWPTLRALLGALRQPPQRQAR